MKDRQLEGNVTAPPMEEVARTSTSSTSSTEVEGSKNERKLEKNLDNHRFSLSPDMEEDDDVPASLSKEITIRDPEAAIPPATRVQTAQDWTGPDDPENPHNWSLIKRAYHTLPPALIAFVVTFASSVYTPGIADLQEKYDLSRTLALAGLSLYTLGLGFGPIIAAPISETYGRGVVYKFTLPIFMLFTLGAGLSKNFASVLVCRFFAGVTGSPVLAVGAGTNADLFPPALRAVATSFFLMAPFLGPSMGPFIGGFAAQHLSNPSRWTNGWLILIFAAPIWVLSLPMKETYKKIILQQRSKRLDIPPPPRTTPSGAAGIKFLLTVTLLRPVHMLFTEPIVGFLSLYNAFTFGVLFAFFAAYPFIFTSVYHFSVEQVGLTFLAVGLGVCLAVASAILLDRKLYQKEHLRVLAEGKHVVAPEHRLYAAMVGSLGLPIGLFWVAWTSRPGVHWIVPIIGTVPFAWGNLSIFISSALYLVDTYGPLNGASAMAANGIARYVLSAAFPLFTLQMYRSLSIQWATSLLAFVSLAMLPIPWVLFKWGAKIRSKSQYDTLKV